MALRYSYEGELAYYRERAGRSKAPEPDVAPYLAAFPGDPERFFGGRRVLDIGAGGCLYTRYIRRRLSPRKIVALDLMVHDENALDLGEGQRLEFVVGDVFRLPFMAGSFDVVLASLVLHQLPDLGAVLAEVRRVLDPNGVFLAWEPNPFNALILYRYLFRPHSPNQYLFWPWRYAPAFERAGFELHVRYFYGRRPKRRNRFLTSSAGLIARPRAQAGLNA